ncbi:5-(carboxyamino)imidazole ribonucleotide mutase [Candidatus Micrarchaeota archaeon]|nr:5-(carboxyamino)imidazole ribonucleotide mutase [Candidatus Micrarchaeota archaeon]MBU1165866.1 5-(carboxyamino)imidazole ribonucleotide mutase [Candidatus Micrarchaeota archaeon]MBU1886367.1 5-(carboxyamino)imidazole ribonucleotide mutase [Candidatus Micrarchaeota archaeon]
MEKVLILSGSKSDAEIVESVETVLKAFEVPYRSEIASAHRNPDKVDQLVMETSARVFIAVAGLSAALPGVVASKTSKPVIGVPVNAALGGLDSLLSIAQMPPNVPVATVGINGGKNAAMLAIQILALSDQDLAAKLSDFKEKMKQ